MNHLYISCRGSVVPIPLFWRVRLQISSLNEVGYLLFQLKTVFTVVPVFSVKLTILIIVSLVGVSFDFTRPLDKLFMFHLREHLGDGGIEWWQY